MFCVTLEYRKETVNSILASGPAQQDFEWGGSNVSQTFFFGGGRGVEGERWHATLENRVLVTLRYQKVDLK